MSSDFLPFRARGPRFRPAAHVARLRRGEPLLGNIVPASYPPLEEDDPTYAEVNAVDLLDLPIPNPGTSAGLATYARLPGGLPPDPPYRALPSWPWGAAYPATGEGAMARRWDAAVNAPNRIPTVSLADSPQYLRSPRAAGLDLLARILSAKTWELTGDLGGMEPDSAPVWSAGSDLLVAQGTNVERPMAEGAQPGWRPWKIQVSTPTGTDIDDWTLILELFDGAGAVADGEVEWAESSRLGLDAWAEDGGDCVMGPRIRGLLVYRVGEPGPTEGDTGTWHISSVTRPDREPPELLPITLCGFALYGSRTTASTDVGLTGGISISPASFWTAEEWSD